MRSECQLIIKICINNKETDLGLCGLMSSHSRYEKCDLSTPVMIDRCVLAVPYPKEESRLLAPIHPFQSMVRYHKNNKSWG